VVIGWVDLAEAVTWNGEVTVAFPAGAVIVTCAPAMALKQHIPNTTAAIRMLARNVFLRLTRVVRTTHAIF